MSIHQGGLLPRKTQKLKPKKKKKNQSRLDVTGSQAELHSAGETEERAIDSTSGSAAVIVVPEVETGYSEQTPQDDDNDDEVYATLDEHVELLHDNLNMRDLVDDDGPQDWVKNSLCVVDPFIQVKVHIMTFSINPTSRSL